MSSRIDDGHPTYITFSAEPSQGMLIWEKTVTPPGLDGGGPNDTTTMRNTKWRTNAPKKLISLAEGSFVVAYDPEAFEVLLNLLNVNNQVKITFPNGDTYEFWGWLNTFVPGECVEGEQPTATCSIFPSNQNASLVETDPVYTAAA